MCLLCLINKLPQTAYCERGNSSGFFVEPINVFTSFAFLIAGFFANRLLKNKGIKSKELLILPWFLAVTGIGSFIYHTARNSITLIFDAVPTFLFLLYVLFLILKQLFGNKIKAFVALIGFICLEIASSIFLPKDSLNGSIAHIATIIFAILLGWLLIKRYGSRVKLLIICLISLYVVAVFFRSIDLWICQFIPIGTHFLWHILAASVGYLAISLISKVKTKS